MLQCFNRYKLLFVPGVAVKTIDNRNWRSDMSPKGLRIGVLSLFFCLLSSENKYKKSIDSVFLYANMPRIESDTSVVGCIG